MCMRPSIATLFIIAKTGSKPKTRDQGQRMIIRNIKGHQRSDHDQKSDIGASEHGTTVFSSSMQAGAEKMNFI